jgi:pullulanase/glycogen debranching enzyme
LGESLWSGFIADSFGLLLCLVGKTIGDTRRTRVNRNAEDEAAARAAAGAAARERCDLGTLHGTYVGANDGDVTEGDYKGPFAAAEFQWFDGNGKIEGVYSVNYNSRNIFSRAKFAGTYRVKANCTGSVTLADGTEYDLFIDPDGSMFAWVQTEPPEYVVSGVEQRVTRQRIGD